MMAINVIGMFTLGSYVPLILMNVYIDKLRNKSILQQLRLTHWTVSMALCDCNMPAHGRQKPEGRGRPQQERRREE
eukprot:15206513-Heterocapsa_arctica.AAC.1